MAPFIRAVLSNLVGDEEASKIDIVANDAIIEADGKWEIKFRHPTRSVLMFRRLDHINDRLYVRSGYGHDKSQAILQYRNLPDPPTIFFFGDGVSGEPFALCFILSWSVCPDLRTHFTHITARSPRRICKRVPFAIHSFYPWHRFRYGDAVERNILPALGHVYNHDYDD